jgi:hypothetical protein
MGLDMMLYARKGGGDVTEVAYWRKANAIHEWFVQNVQGGTDECEAHPVTREQLQELAAVCRRVLDASQIVKGQVHNGTLFRGGQRIEQYMDGEVIADPAVAQELLPTQQGFFFGSYDYDEWYVQSLQETIEQVDRALALDGEWTFEYQSSW